MTDRFPASGEDFTLHRRRWSADDPHRVLVIVHGLAEHSARYEHVGRYFAARGYAVHAFDQRGHGESGGPRVHAPSFEVLLDDVEAFLGLLRGEHPGLPLVLLGHSMGGLEVASLLVSRRPQLHAAVLSGPALRVPAGALRMTLGRVLSWVAPRMQIPSGISPDSISRDPQVVADYVADPLIPSTLSVGLGAALIDAARATAERGGGVEVPLLIVHGEADTLCDVEGSRAFHAQVNAPGSALRTYPTLRHEVFNEPEHEIVLADVAEWLDKLEPAA